MRPPALEALYHRFENTLFDEALDKLSANENVRVVLLPRNEAQRAQYAGRERVIVPSSPLPGADLIAASDLVISAGGTINREAAALGVPAASIYAGKWAAVDEGLVNEGRLRRISSNTDLHGLSIRKKDALSPRRSLSVIDEILGFILES
jgi:predicted glycosyltransferase